MSEVESSPFLVPPSPEDLDLGGVSTPTVTPPVRQHADLSLSLSLPPNTCLLIGGMPHRILGWVGISKLAKATIKTLRKTVSAMKRYNRKHHRNGT
jgi:hypothetical protein